MKTSRFLRFLPILMLAPLIGCQDALDSVANKVEHPLPGSLVSKMKANDMSIRSPIMMRIFKEEGILELWKQKGNGRFEKVTEYEICKWSGELGPKRREGDRQAPEGYYRVYPAQMNPNSSYYLSFNLGYPNRFDQAHGRTGSNLMVHGACSSAGCYSMTDEQVLEIYAFAREAFRGGQDFFLVAAYPFHMTPENMARHRKDLNFEFWKMLKIGYDQFELTKRPPKVNVCEKRYVFNQKIEDPGADFNASGVCPPMHTPPLLASAYQSYQKTWNEAFKVAVMDERRKEAERLAAKAEKAARKVEVAARKAEIEAEKLARAQDGDEASPIGSLFSLATGSIAGALQPGQTPAPAPIAGPVPMPARDVSSTGDAGVPGPQAANVPLPVPKAPPASVAAAGEATRNDDEKPFWKIWRTN